MHIGNIRLRLDSQGAVHRSMATLLYGSTSTSSQQTLSAGKSVTQIMSLSVPNAVGADGLALNDQSGKAATPHSLIKKAKSIGKNLSFSPYLY